MVCEITLVCVAQTSSFPSTHTHYNESMSALNDETKADFKCLLAGDPTLSAHRPGSLIMLC